MMTTTLTWHDSRTEPPKTAGPFLCVTTDGKIKTAKYSAMPSRDEMNDWAQTGGQKQWDAYLKATSWYA